MKPRYWHCPMLPPSVIAPAIALLDAAGYVRRGAGIGTYTSEEEPMYRDGTYIADLCVCEDPARPVVDRLHAMLTPGAPLPPWPGDVAG